MLTAWILGTDCIADRLTECNLTTAGVYILLQPPCNKVYLCLAGPSTYHHSLRQVGSRQVTSSILRDLSVIDIIFEIQFAGPMVLPGESVTN